MTGLVHQMAIAFLHFPRGLSPLQTIHDARAAVQVLLQLSGARAPEPYAGPSVCGVASQSPQPGDLFNGVLQGDG